MNKVAMPYQVLKIILAIIWLTACTSSTVKSTSIPILDATKTTKPPTPTAFIPTATKAATAAPTGTASPVLDKGINLTSDEIQNFKDQQVVFDEFWSYWEKATNNPVNTALKQRLVPHIYTDIALEGGKTVGIAWEDTKDSTALYALPWYKGQTLKKPPNGYTTEGDPLPNNGPLRLTQEGYVNNIPYRLGWSENRWAKIASDGFVLQEIQDDGTWPQEVTKRITEKVSVTNEDHRSFVMDDGVKITWDLISTANIPNQLELNIDGFSNALRKLATVISRGFYQVSGETNYDEFMQKWLAIQNGGAPNSLKLSVVAYVNGESKPRRIQIPIPDYEIPKFFVNWNDTNIRRKHILYHEGMYAYYTGWYFLENGKLFMVVGSRESNKYSYEPMDEESAGLSMILSSLSGSTKSLYLEAYFKNGVDAPGRILEAK